MPWVLWGGFTCRVWWVPSVNCGFVIRGLSAVGVLLICLNIMLLRVGLAFLWVVRGFLFFFRLVYAL